MEYEEAQNNERLKEHDYQRQTDLAGFFMHLESVRTAKGWNSASEQSSFLEQYSADYTIWIPNDDVNLLAIGNINEQRKVVKRLSDNDLKDIKDQLSSNDLYSIFTFADPTKLSKYNHAQLVLLKSDIIVHITRVEKGNKNSFLCFDSTHTNTSFEKTDVGTIEELVKRPHFVIRESAADIRKIEQITCILFDTSGSMEDLVGSEGNENSLLELSTIAFGAWRDRLTSYRLPHAVGLIYFGCATKSASNVFMHQLGIFPQATGATLANDSIVVRCDITRDFNDFEKALGNRPECGSNTPLYDAIDKGIERIVSFRMTSQNRLSSNCKELILCLTDGQDTCSKVSNDKILQKLVDNKITFDAISFVSNPNARLVEFCEKTKGYYYINIPHEKESMLNIFELEAAISVQDREESNYGKIETPQRRKAKLLDKPAIAAKNAKIGDGRTSNICLRRIMLEINQLNKKELKNFDLFISNENISFWKLIMHGETGTPYSDGRWLLFVEFSQYYPQQPPEIRFVTKIYHCNINDDGKICHDVLTTAWSQKTSMYNVLMEILHLLREPNADDALCSVKGAQYKASKEDYENTIKEWKIRYASATVDQLKVQYSLE